MKKHKEKSLKHPIGIDARHRDFGFVAIEKGFIRLDHLYEALMRQRAQETAGAERRPIGTILKDLGYLSVPQINEVLQHQHKAESRKENWMPLKSNRSLDRFR
jgi:hypothetical protein